MERGQRQFDQYAQKSAAISRTVELDVLAAAAKEGELTADDRLHADLLGYVVRLDSVVNGLIAFLVHNKVVEKEALFDSLAKYLRDELNGFLDGIEKKHGRKTRNRIAMFARAAEREAQWKG